MGKDMEKGHTEKGMLGFAVAKATAMKYQEARGEKMLVAAKSFNSGHKITPTSFPKTDIPTLSAGPSTPLFTPLCCQFLIYFFGFIPRPNMPGPSEVTVRIVKM